MIRIAQNLSLICLLINRQPSLTIFIPYKIQEMIFDSNFSNFNDFSGQELFTVDHNHPLFSNLLTKNFLKIQKPANVSPTTIVDVNNSNFI